MPENGAKTVRDWEPQHKGCTVIWRVSDRSGPTEYHRVTVAWVRPKVRGLERVKFIRFGVSIDGSTEDALSVLDLRLEGHIDRIVHEDSLTLLARGKRGQRADTDRFEAEQKQKGELCPA